MCIADAVHGAPAFRSSYERGRRMPLTQGATSKVILAQLPPRRLARLLTRHAPDDGDALRASLAAMRKRGYMVSRGEIDRGAVGLAAPVGPSGLASLSLVVDQAALDPATEQRLTLLLVAAASLVAGALPQPEPLQIKQRPARAAPTGRAIP